MTALRVVGTSVLRSDAIAKSTGRAAYPQDFPVPDGCLHAATVRAWLPHAELRSVDLTASVAVPGVVRVVTARDITGTNRFGLITPDQPVLAERLIRCAGEPVALVLATSERSAREGARRALVDLDPLPALCDPELACAVDAPLIHPELAVQGASRSHPNMVAEFAIRHGDARAALAAAAVAVRGTYRTGWVEHAFLAPEAGIAEPSAGGYTLHTASQWPEQDLRQAAKVLGIPTDQLRLVQATIGGAFGGREDVSVQILLLLAAQVSGRTVRMVWDRTESIAGHGKRHPFRMHYELGADHDGRLVALAADLLADAGAYASTSRAVLANAAALSAGPYAIEHVAIDARAVYTNNPVTCAFRGFGANQVNFALEQGLNKLAGQLHLDPAELRRRNIAPVGGRVGTGQAVASRHGLAATLQQAAERARMTQLPADHGPWRHGRGIACAYKNAGFGFGFDDHATALVTITERGAIVRIGAAEVGQGVETVLAQIAAESLGMDAANVTLEWRDSASAPEAGSSSASHQTIVSGNAVRLACERARRLLDDLGGLERLPAGGISATETYHAPSTDAHPSAGQTFHAASYASCVADVAVDSETGRVRVLRVVEAVDAGRVINPQLFTAQVEGGVVMGQGYALQERFDVVDGVPRSLSLGDLCLPTAVDAAPVIETIAVEEPDANGPFGARGIGEVTMLPVVPAITAAMHAATGAWVDELPATPERVLQALDNIAPRR